MPRKKTVVHYKPAYRETTYCGLNPLAEQAQGRPIKFTANRSKATCPDCEGLPKD